MSLLDFFHRASPKAKQSTPPERDKSQLVAQLTPREREAYLLLLDGFTLRYCAEQMGVKYPTVNTYQTAIYKKLGVRSRAELIIQYRDMR